MMSQPNVSQQVAQDAVAVINTGAGNVNVTTGLSEQRFAELIDESLKRQGIPATQLALDNFFKILQHAPVPLADLDKTLREIAERHRELLLIRAAASTSEDPMVQTLLQQATQALEQFDFETADNLLNQAQQQDAAAIEVLEQEAQRIAKVTSQRKVSRATTLFTLAKSKDTQLAYRDAARYYQEAAESLPAGHEEDKATYLNNAGFSLYKAGKYQFAKLLYERTLIIVESIFGKQHQYYAFTLNNLALLHQSQDEVDEALSLHKQALRVIEQVLGKQHLEYARILNNIALAHHLCGEYNEALSLYTEALQIRKQILGEEHSECAAILHNIAGVYYIQGNYEESLLRYEKVLKTREREFGRYHPDCAQTIMGIAGLHYVQGKYEQALPLFQETLRIHEQVLGKQHPDTAISIWWLATYHEKMLDYEQALPLYEQAVEILANALGDKHPNMQMVQRNYQSLLQQLGNSKLPETIPKAAPDLNRNAPCPCGSGQRYKHCCGQAV